ncbi:hypothetical protein JTM24_33630, partial [Pseudomonas aeruginosa]|nr:hypothetical protein [Pseudomonas aeruginosa]
YSMLTLAQVFIFLTGFIILVNSLVDMARMTQEGSQITKIRIVLALVAATLMMNSGAALSVFGNTFFNKIGTEEVCFIVEEKGLDESCFSNELSGLTGALKDRVERISSDSTFKMIEEKIKIVIGIFQL